MPLSWLSAPFRLLAPLFAVAAMFVPGLALAAMVVASSGPSSKQFPAGKKLNEDGRITLQKGDSVTILDRRGTRKLRGPGRFNVSQPGRPLPNPAFAILTRQKSSNRVTVAAVRTGEDGRPLSPNLWYVDVDKPGTTCVADPASLMVWRAYGEKSAQYRFVSSGGVNYAVSFARDAVLAPWDPAVAPVTDGATYSLSDAKGKQIGEVRYVSMPSPPTDEEELAQALIDNGCTAQLQLLSDSLLLSRL